MEIQVNEMELQRIRQRLLALKGKTTNNAKTIPTLQGSGNMADISMEMAETFSSIEDSILSLIDSTIAFIDRTDAEFKEAESKSIQAMNLQS